MKRKKVTLDHFTHRMRKRHVKKEVEYIKDLNEQLFQKRLREAKHKKSPPFEKSELDRLLKSLKTGKSKDQDEYISELFKEGVVGIDLKVSLLKMMNRMKTKIVVPECPREGFKKQKLQIIHIGRS